MNSENVIVAVVTGLLTWMATRTKSHHEVKRQKVESKSNTEGIYVQNMSVILAEYKEQVSGFRAELSAVKKEFSEFKKSHYEEVREYKSLVDAKDERIEELEAENDHLREENTELKLENAYLKEGNDGRIIE